MTDPSPMSSLESLQPRFPGMDRGALAALHVALDQELVKDEGRFEYRFVEAYAHRANVRFALGMPAELVMDDFLMAGRCLSGDPGVHLSRHSEEQLLTRRIRPVEFGVLSGNLRLAERLASNYGVPVAQARAGMGTPAFLREMRILSPALVGQPIAEASHLMGLAAALYCGALASAVQGYHDEVRFALRWLAQADWEGELSEAEKAVMFRYAGLCQAIAGVIQPGSMDLGAMLADQIQRYTNRVKNARGLEFQKPEHPQRYVDTGALAIIALATINNVEIDADAFPPRADLTPYAAGYSDLIRAMQSGFREAVHEAIAGAEAEAEAEPSAEGTSGGEGA